MRAQKLDGDDHGPDRLAPPTEGAVGVGKPAPPRHFRETFGGDLLDAIGNPSAARQLAGHADPSTTSKYDRRGKRATREAASHPYLPHSGE